jgi:MFS family permease
MVRRDRAAYAETLDRPSVSTTRLDALRQPDIRRLELGWALSLAGTFSYTVAMLAYTYAEGGARLVAAYGVASTVPGALLTPVLMSLTDRVGSATMLRLTTGTRTLLVAVAAALALADAHAALVVVPAAAAHALSATFRPTQASVLPWLARTPAELTAATVAATMAENLAALVGPIVAGRRGRAHRHRGVRVLPAHGVAEPATADRA